MKERLHTFLDNLPYENFAESSHDLCHGHRGLLTECLLDDLGRELRMMRMQIRSRLTFRTACLGSACRRYASNRSYCSGLRLSIKTLRDNSVSKQHMCEYALTEVNHDTREGLGETRERCD